MIPVWSCFVRCPTRGFRPVARQGAKGERKLPCCGATHDRAFGPGNAGPARDATRDQTRPRVPRIPHLANYVLRWGIYLTLPSSLPFLLRLSPESRCHVWRSCCDAVDHSVRNDHHAPSRRIMSRSVEEGSQAELAARAITGSLVRRASVAPSSAHISRRARRGWSCWLAPPRFAPLPVLPPSTLPATMADSKDSK